MRKLITVLAIAISTLTVANAADTYNGWTSELIQKTFPQLVNSTKDKEYSSCFLTAIINNYNYNAYINLVNHKNERKVLNTALASCGLPSNETSTDMKNRLEGAFHKEVKSITSGTETITAAIPQLDSYKHMGIKYYYSWINRDGEEVYDIVFCYELDADHKSFNQQNKHVYNCQWWR